MSATSDNTEQAILTLSNAVQLAAAHAVGEATFPRFYVATIVKMVGEGRYRVVMDDQLYELSVYGSGLFRPKETVWVVAPYNSNDVQKMFILGTGSRASTEAADEDHEILMQLVSDCARKLDKSAVVQEPGQSTTNVMSQKAVTDLLDDMDTGVLGILIDGNKLPVDDAGFVSIPIATTQLGLVRSKSRENGVTVDGDGSMQLESLDVMRVNQHDDNWLILDGGNATK